MNIATSTATISSFIATSPTIIIPTVKIIITSSSSFLKQIKPQNFQDFLGLLEFLVGTVFGGIIILLFKFIERKDKQSKIKVKANFSFPVYQTKLGEMMLQISAINDGEKTVTLTSCGILLPDRMTIIKTKQIETEYLSQNTLPYVLEASKRCIQFFSIGEIKSTLRENKYSGKVKVKGFFRDATDHEYFSKPIKLDLK